MPGPSPERAAASSRDDDPGLLRVARDSLAHGVRHGAPRLPDPQHGPQAWREPGATFVTLSNPDDSLRGCMGSLEPIRSLADDVAENAFRAGFADPRFEPLSTLEAASVHLHIAVLGPLEPLEVGSEEELIAALRPGVDGLVLRDGRVRATFLPAVWGNVPDPRVFVRELQRKAGLSPGHWSPTTEALRYATRSIG